MDTGLSSSPEPTVELRAAVRFPLQIPIRVLTAQGEKDATTVNISANGILFELDTQLGVGTPVEFTIPMPAAAMGTPTDVVVRCIGRVVRSCLAKEIWQAAACIDKYYFSH